MASFEFDYKDKQPQKRKPKSHTFVKDNDLQIHIPTIKDPKLSYRSSRYQAAYAMEQLEGVDSWHLKDEEVKKVMREAKNSYDSMMQIREQLRQAYQEFMQTQADKN